VRPFDWMTLLREQRIHYVTSGPNVKRGEVNIKCPWCGSADPSQHMGLNLETGWYSCWRNRAQHSGKSPLRLIMALLRVPYQRARSLAGLDEGYIDPEGFDALAARLLRREGMTGRPEEVRRRKLFMDASFRPITRKGATRRAYDYLREERGFNGASAAGDDADVLCRLYGLHMGDGDFAARIVLPYVLDGELVTWTGRAIGPSKVRYKDLSIKESILPPKATLFNHDAIYDPQARVLLVEEGPFDALKTDFYGEPFGVRAVAMSTNTITDEQAFLLQGAVEFFERVFVVLDNKTGYGAVDSMRMKQSLAFLGDKLGTEHVPFGAGDPGELTPREATEWAQTLIETIHF
jgi:hypothetical protein